MMLDPINNHNVQAIGESGCWIWLGGTYNTGYGAVRFGGKSWLTHRLSKVLQVGELHKSEFVCHRCDERLCVNPDHLFVGSASDNTKDMWAKGRAFHGRGSSAGRAKITEQIAANIYTSPLSIAEAADVFGVSRSTVLSIRKREQWRHATENLPAPKYENLRGKTYSQMTAIRREAVSSHNTSTSQYVKE